MPKLAFDAPAVPPAGTLEGQMAAHREAQTGSGLGDMALTGAALGLGGGALAGAALGLGGGALAGLVSSLRQKWLRPQSPYKPLYGTDPVSIPVAKMAENPITTGMTTDPMHGLKLLGGLGVPMVGGFLLAKGLGNWRQKQRRQDTAAAIQGDYQKALNDYATTASGLKLASDVSALDRLAMVKTAGPELHNGFGLLGQGNPIGEGATAALNLAVPLAAAVGGYHLYKGLQKKKQLADQAKQLRDSAVADWRRKELFFRPPPLQATPQLIPAQG